MGKKYKKLKRKFEYLESEIDFINDYSQRRIDRNNSIKNFFMIAFRWVVGIAFILLSVQAIKYLFSW